MPRPIAGSRVIRSERSEFYEIKHTQEQVGDRQTFTLDHALFGLDSRTGGRGGVQTASTSPASTISRSSLQRQRAARRLAAAASTRAPIRSAMARASATWRGSSRCSPRTAPS